jgi:hypothetical protein
VYLESTAPEQVVVAVDPTALAVVYVVVQVGWTVNDELLSVLIQPE